MLRDAATLMVVSSPSAALAVSAVSSAASVASSVLSVVSAALSEEELPQPVSALYCKGTG